MAGCEDLLELHTIKNFVNSGMLHKANFLTCREIINLIVTIGNSPVLFIPETPCSSPKWLQFSESDLYTGYLQIYEDELFIM